MQQSDRINNRDQRLQRALASAGPARQRHLWEGQPKYAKTVTDRKHQWQSKRIERMAFAEPTDRGGRDLS